MTDRITVAGLSCHLANGAGPSAFGLTPPPPCPLELQLDIDLLPGVVPHCVDEDDMNGLGVNYSSVSKAVYAAVADPKRVFPNPSTILREAAVVALRLPAVAGVTVRARLPRALLQAQSADYTQYFSRSSPPSTLPQPTCTIRDLRVNCVIGLHPHERAERQRLEADITVDGYEPKSWDHRVFADEAFTWLDKSEFGTLESLVDSFARHLLSLPILSTPKARVDVTLRKPSALPFATPAIRASRNAASFAKRGGVYPVGTRFHSSTVANAANTPPRVFIAVGSNLGDRVGYVRRAVQLLQEGGCILVDTSRLYESAPMYVEDQERFLNGAVEIQTSLKPFELLRLLKRIELEVGRIKTYRNGPRVIDLDLVAYGNEVVHIGEPGDEPDEDGVGWLTVPHASLAEREFVLRPLADIAPDFTPPGLLPISELLARAPPGRLEPVIPFPYPARPLRLTTPSTPAIMAIFNATPDSFSDGHVTRTDTAHAVRMCENMMAAPNPPAIIDIGGMSTRPNAEPCTEEEELARVIPLVQAARRRSSPLATVPLSVDTYRASVARAAVEAGASCINDVRGGREPGMLAAMAYADVPVVLMHSRGDSVSMLAAESKGYAGGVLAGVRSELAEAVAAAKAAGVKRWDIVLDPGLGFAKSHDDHLRLLRDIGQFATGDLAGYSLLVGASRKRFVGQVTGRKVASERGSGDAAINTLCAMSGAVDVLRVHDPQAAAETVKMAIAIRDIK
ncbi:hypothetical protein CcaverHIS002_0211600 [Cutaneotrichosporon cavernicola]|uniref:Pterin-binding domain-containing protein n=1 Tax=Cutaneotrichosporon cavernicola TaxID=279322 RepID=A0AA48L2P0_9TREE|nr:uncharacterized protein CcaverHIS019_0211600 [Cutaneotrichosporon cavernicola]BEI82000.1 hypothetical protein CcaverHIS002_0211600 [Cutaneotrichosporon cavernicola]BEI89798.1 hypothetical protein CcaverHIS019_0211600 [Cutaneotrichosporon cavernicola]BEI97569.1 hypothetical protein CcaverHIS631_0211580 [Cutaneotrichosporon cavernicola]BEJ05348.1 hypothetical protein CcaverHIS641_0211650 [Cutaneotrichosporon cavernicola]